MKPLTFKEWLEDEFVSRPKMNQTTLAISIGVGQSTVSKWLKGLSKPDPPNCHKLALFFDLPPDHVLTIAGHRALPNPGSDLSESRPIYRTGSRAQMDRLLDQLTDDQIRSLLKFLESML